MNKAQKATRQYHDEFFRKAKLFEKGTWIAESEPILMRLVENQYGSKSNIQILDLGCGVGRNAIPLAKIIGPNGGRVTCVDVLEIAIEKLTENADKYGVTEYIQSEVRGVEEFVIQPDYYDLIVAFSVLEHGVSSEQGFFKVIENIQKGTKMGGLNYLGITTNLQELDARTREELSKDIVYDTSYEKAKTDLEAVYAGWQVLTAEKSFYDEQYMKNGKMIIWQSDFLMFVVRKS